MPENKDIKQRYSQARSDAGRAARAVREASAAELKKLLLLSQDERFSALGRTDLDLTPEDRQKLLKSVWDKESKIKKISAKTASLWAIWRTRLSYRVALLGTIGVFTLSAAGFYVVALRQTPMQFVVSRYAFVIPAPWRLSDGSTVEDQIEVGQYYVLFSRNGEHGMLRKWISGRGYAETRVPVKWFWSRRDEV